MRAHPDVIVLDLMLPDLSGEEITRSLRETSDVPDPDAHGGEGNGDDRVNGEPAQLTRSESTSCSRSRLAPGGCSLGSSSSREALA